MVKPAFWAGVGLCLRVFEPLIKVLHVVDGDIKPSMAFPYGDIINTKDEINVAIGRLDKNGTVYNSVMEIIHTKMEDRLDRPLQLAAYCLNPYYSYNDPTIFLNELVMDGLISAIETFYYDDYDKQNKILNDELDKFKDKAGHFGKPVAKAGCSDYDFNPAKWWGTYGTQVLTLQGMAMRILPLTSSSSGCERNWSCFEGIHTKKRSTLATQHLDQLVFVQYNAKMNGKKEKGMKNKKKDPLVMADAIHAQGWLVEGGDDGDIQVEQVLGLTWKQIEDTCATEEGHTTS